jgi:hypothetical protein
MFKSFKISDDYINVLYSYIVMANFLGMFE